MRDDGSPGAGDILAGGAGRGVALEEFGPIWNSARLRLGRASWGTSGLEPFLTHAVPYTGTSSGRLSEDAVRVFLASAGQRDDYRVLELGAGSGVFAKLFLDHLRNLAPDVYHRTTYVVTDASQSMLAAQDAHALLDPHAARVERYVLDATCDIPPTGDFDAVLGTYVLDSLPFDLLAVKDGRVWRKEACTAVEGSVCDDPGGLIAALRDDDPAALAEWQWIAPHLALQTRHTEVNRAELSFGNSLPTDTGAETMPFVHCYGALACIEASLRALRPGGVAIFSDYGHLAPLPRYEFLEFQTYGNSVAVGVNFFQLTAAFENWTGAVLYRPAKDAGTLHTRVVQKATTELQPLQDLIETLYGADAYRAQNDPLDKARMAMKSRYFESARSAYLDALRLQPENWAIMEEIASVFLMATEDYDAAIDMADQGLVRNPVSAGLWRARGEALLALGRLQEARIAYEHLAVLAPTVAGSWRCLAELCVAEDDLKGALEAVATALSHDHDCEEQDALLDIQKTVLQAMALKHHSVLTGTANQMRGLDTLPD